MQARLLLVLFGEFRRELALPLSRFLIGSNFMTNTRRCLALFAFQDDFLLRHYDKGPCKNKLGHSRASVVWHRAQVIGIFAGFGILLLVASPLLLLGELRNQVLGVKSSLIFYDDFSGALHRLLQV
jgi:hypothetical protein